MSNLRAIPDIILICTNKRAEIAIKDLKIRCLDIIIEHMEENRIGDDWYLVPKTDKGDKITDEIYHENNKSEVK